MNAIAVNLFECGQCRAKHVAKAGAEACCICSTCGQAFDKGAHYCRDCSAKNREKREAEALAKAPEVPDAGDCVYSDHGGGRDGYFENLDACIESLWEQVEDGELAVENWPEFVWHCKPQTLRQITIDDVLERASDDFDDDFDPLDLDGVDELTAALQAFYQKNEDVRAWFPSKEKIRVPSYESVKKDNDERRAKLEGAGE